MKKQAPKKRVVKRVSIPKTRPEFDSVAQPAAMHNLIRYPSSEKSKREVNMHLKVISGLERDLAEAQESLAIWRTFYSEAVERERQDAMGWSGAQTPNGLRRG